MLLREIALSLVLLIDDLHNDRAEVDLEIKSTTVYDELILGVQLRNSVL